MKNAQLQGQVAEDDAVQKKDVNLIRDQNVVIKIKGENVDKLESIDKYYLEH
jgi:hypothetical protein